MGSKVVIRASLFVVLLSVVIGVVISYDIYQDRKTKVEIKGSVDLLETHSELTNKKIGILQPTDQVQVLRIRYGKDYQAIKVHAADGREGWIMSGGSFEVSH